VLAKLKAFADGSNTVLVERSRLFRLDGEVIIGILLGFKRLPSM